MTQQANEMREAVTTSLAKQNGGNGKTNIYALIQKQTPGFKMALPKDFDADRFTRLVLTALKSNPKLSQCTPASILAAVMLSAQAGLEPNTPLHEASIIPYGNKAQFQFEYRGLLKLVWNSGLVSNFDYGIIYKEDEWEYVKGFDPKFYHKPVIGGERKIDDAIAAYAIAKIIGGGNAITFWELDKVKKHAARYSKTYGERYKDSPWQTNFEFMWIKTAIKELCDKKLPRKTTNEALKFHNLIARDETVSKLTKDQITAAEMGELIKPDEIESEAVYEDVTNGEKNGKRDPGSKTSKESDAPPPEFFITQIQQATTKKAVDEILKSRIVQGYIPQAKAKVDKAGLEKIKELGLRDKGNK